MRPTAARGRALARIAAYCVTGLLAAVALRYGEPLPPRPAAHVVAAPVPAVPRPPVWTQRVDTLGRGETLGSLLERGGLPTGDALLALRAATREVDARRMPAGMPVTVRGLETDSLPSEIVLQLAIDRIVRLRRTADGWTGTEERLPWTTDTVVVSGVVRSNLYDALDSGAAALAPRARAELAWTLADIYEYRVDMSRDLQDGDAFRVLVERETGPGGAVRLGRVLAASLTLSGAELEAIRFTSQRISGEYFDRDGKSLRAPFLRAPLAFRRISSVFGLRRHPILNTWRQHRGTDYAAAAGTPVRSVGDGVVVRAGWGSGYGNVVEVRHRNGYVTRYGHLRGFAGGARRGSRVAIGQTIGYVGSTGLSTAPHLHFEVLVGGVQRDPRTALRMKGGEPIPGAERAAFESERSRLLASLGQPDGPLRLASAR